MSNIAFTFLQREERYHASMSKLELEKRHTKQKQMLLDSLDKKWSRLSLYIINKCIKNIIKLK